MLHNFDIVELTELRRELHKKPEISGEERETAATIQLALEQLSPSRIWTGLGGHGVAAEFDSGAPGPCILFRAELDALPIQEISDADWVSQVPGKGHLCGHDGHMVMLLGLGRLIARTPPAKGRIILMFQPAEEDGSGARAVVADPRYSEIAPDWAFAIHNEPGRPFGHVSTRAGLINCASQGLKITLSGKTAHAASPEDGTSPALAISELLPALTALGEGGALDDSFRLVTITHVNIGAPTFGIAPGEGVIYATLRTAMDAPMQSIADQARSLVNDAAARHGLRAHFETHDDFAASINDKEAVEIACAAMDAVGVSHDSTGLPMRASEDFGVLGWSAKAAMLCLGPGVDYAALHNPDYDFPDDLTPIGPKIFFQIIEEISKL